MFGGIFPLFLPPNGIFFFFYILQFFKISKYLEGQNQGAVSAGPGWFVWPAHCVFVRALLWVPISGWFNDHIFLIPFSQGWIPSMAHRESCGSESWEYQWNDGIFPLPIGTLPKVSLWQILSIWCISLTSETSITLKFSLQIHICAYCKYQRDQDIRGSNFHLCISMNGGHFLIPNFAKNKSSNKGFLCLERIPVTWKCSVCYKRKVPYE